jgi:hypothetical protein
VNLLDQAVENANLAASIEQFAAHGATDKASAAGDENSFPQSSIPSVHATIDADQTRTVASRYCCFTAVNLSCRSIADGSSS